LSSDLSGRSKLAYFDQGLQPERTLLAWKRTILLLGVGTAVGARFTLEQGGWVSLTAGILGLFLAGVSYFAAIARYSNANRRLLEFQAILSGGALFALVASAMILLTVLAFWYLLGVT